MSKSNSGAIAAMIIEANDQKEKKKKALEKASAEKAGPNPDDLPDNLFSGLVGLMSIINDLIWCVIVGAIIIFVLRSLL